VIHFQVKAPKFGEVSRKALSANATTNKAGFVQQSPSLPNNASAQQKRKQVAAHN